MAARCAQFPGRPPPPPRPTLPLTVIISLPSPTSPQVNVPLPPAGNGKKWCRVVDTNLASPKDFTPGGNSGVDATYGVQAFSSIMLIAKDA